MAIINRAVAVIKPKQPFVDWANGLPDAAGGMDAMNEFPESDWKLLRELQPVALEPDAKQWKGEWIDEPGHTACFCTTNPREMTPIVVYR